MPDLVRFMTRVREDYCRFRGSTDRLCSARQMLHALPRGERGFMEAMREELAWHCLHFPAMAESCWQAGCSPRQLVEYEDLSRIPHVDEAPGGDLAREQRRWHIVAGNCLADLGWSRPRRRALLGLPEVLRWWRGRIIMGRCSAGNWHWPRVVRVQGDRFFSPCLRGGAQLWVPGLSDGAMLDCSCGRGAQYVRPELATNCLQKVFLQAP